MSKLSDDITRLPQMVFGHDNNDYWVLLPFFEKVEEATGKLIDLGESVMFTPAEHNTILDLIEKEIENVPEGDEELFLQDDGELLTELLGRIKGMINIAQKSGGQLSAVSSET